MKILLLGEFSGLFNSLKEGLVELGHDVTLMSDGDDFKKYPSDYSWRVDKLGRFNRFATVLNGFLSIRKFSGFDVVYVVTPLLICGKPQFTRFLFEYLKNNNGKVYLCGAGMTACIFKYWYSNRGTKYNTYVNGYLDDVGGDINRLGLNSNKLEEAEKYVMSIIDGYIPIMFEYAAPFSDHPKNLGTIPIPINWKKFEYTPNYVDGKIRVFHGISKTCKGGKFIAAAFDQLKAKYAKDVDFIIKGNIPFNEYIPYLRTMNVVVDDANAYSLGMNALFSMAMGRIVLGGAETDGNIALAYDTANPAYNISSDVEQISQTLESIIDNRDRLEEYGQESRNFVCREHDYLRVAEKYLNLWNSK